MSNFPGDDPFDWRATQAAPAAPPAEEKAQHQHSWGPNINLCETKGCPAWRHAPEEKATPAARCTCLLYEPGLHAQDEGE